MAEKKLNDLPRELRMLHTKGADAASRENYDYAIELFNQVLNKEPLVYDVRRALRGAQLKKEGGGRGMFKKMWSTASSQPLVAKAQLALRRDPAEALQIAEQVLNNDPHNSFAHRVVVEAAAALQMPKTAVMSLEILAGNSPKDREVAVKFANALADAGEVGRGEAILAALHNEYPMDQDLALALKNISARKTMEKGGYEGAADGTGSFRDMLKDKEEATALEQENRQVKTEDVAERLIRDYEARLKTEPQNVKLLRNLGELYTQKKDYDRALEYYNRIKASDSGADAGLDRAITDLILRKYDAQIAALDPAAPEFAQETARLEAEKQSYELAECQKRAERFPTDLQIRFELGQLYLKAGKLSEAIQEFQKARANPHRKVQTLNFLGQCFARRNMNELAMRNFEEAIKDKPVFDDEKKDLVYNLAGVLEKMGRKEEAMKQYESIYGVDITFRDVEAKVNSFYSGQ
ncbi:MAG TPA: tetratricopeptide repeat protein [Verrucomicrobiae bacterium]|nr:tetratricopeptide repeat protein [Verrucomicrobiae bacterium]